MKKFLIVLALSAGPYTAKAQTAQVTQLVLNIQKLAQLREILAELKAGYDILFTGYTTIKNISEGNFKLHDAFLSALLKVSPAVKNYARVKDILAYQLAISREYRQTRAQLAASGVLTQTETAYIEKVYSRLAGSCLANLEALEEVLTDQKLRASDAERLQRIDLIYQQLTDQLTFLRHFNSNALLLTAQRKNELQQTSTLQELLNLQH
jgi:hypothetical protein